MHKQLFTLYWLLQLCLLVTQSTAQDGYETYVQLMRKDLTTNQKMEVMKKVMALNKKYPSNTPVSEDSMGRLFVVNPPEKLAFLTYDGSQVIHQEVGFAAVLVYTNGPLSRERSRVDTTDYSQFSYSVPGFSASASSG